MARSGTFLRSLEEGGVSGLAIHVQRRKHFARFEVSRSNRGEARGKRLRRLPVMRCAASPTGVYTFATL